MVGTVSPARVFAHVCPLSIASTASPCPSHACLRCGSPLGIHSLKLCWPLLQQIPEEPSLLLEGDKLKQELTQVREPISKPQPLLLPWVCWELTAVDPGSGAQFLLRAVAQARGLA